MENTKPYRILKARTGYELKRLEEKASVKGAVKYQNTEKGEIYRKFIGKEGDFQVFGYYKRT